MTIPPQELHTSGYCQHLVIRDTAGGRAISGPIRDAYLVTTGEVPAHADLMNHAGLEISRFNPTDASQARIAENCRQDYRDVLRARFSVLETKHARLSAPFYWILVFWLMIIFASFGLVAPRHSLSLISIALCAVSLSTAIFVIFDLSRPYGMRGSRRPSTGSWCFG